MSNIHEVQKRFKTILDNNVDEAGPEGLMLIGIAAILEDTIYKVSNNFAQDVVDFHEKFGIQYTGPVRMLPKALSNFRIKRAEEEQREYNEATLIEEKLDALIDALYIDLGTLHLHGFKPKAIIEAFRRVHEANMAKERASEANPGKYSSMSDRFDIVKPPGWKAPDHTDLCE